jgi:glycosyltransferase involved in cell wall biosynthesis
MISFVIPTLNEIKTIEQTLQCITAYSGTHEIIISDGNSKDGTIEICRKYTAKGEYLVFLDADVVIPDIDRFFEAAEERFRSDERLVALTGQYKVVAEQRTLADSIFFRMLGLQFLLSNNVLRIGAAGGEFQMIAGDAFRTVGGFNETLAAAEDMDLFQRLSNIGRTRFERALTVYHTGRRAHTVGWPKLAWEWFTNSMSVWMFKKSASKEWKEIR